MPAYSYVTQRLVDLHSREEIVPGQETCTLPFDSRCLPLCRQQGFTTVVEPFYVNVTSKGLIRFRSLNS